MSTWHGPRKAAKNVFSQSRVRRRGPCCRETVFVCDWLSRQNTSVTSSDGWLPYGSVAKVVFDYFSDSVCVGDGHDIVIDFFKSMDIVEKILSSLRRGDGCVCDLDLAGLAALVLHCCGHAASNTKIYYNNNIIQIINIIQFLLYSWLMPLYIIRIAKYAILWIAIVPLRFYYLLVSETHARKS